MDKRYILILIVIFACLTNLYFISSFSDVIGSASVEGGNYIFSIPSGFSLYDSDNDHVLIHGGPGGLDISIFFRIGNDNYQSLMSKINNDTNYKILSNGSLNTKNTNIDCIYYQRLDDGQNRSTFYFTKYDHNFRVTMINFNYDNDRNKTMEYIDLIADSVRINYKK